MVVCHLRCHLCAFQCLLTYKRVVKAVKGGGLVKADIFLIFTDMVVTAPLFGLDGEVGWLLHFKDCATCADCVDEASVDDEDVTNLCVNLV